MGWHASDWDDLRAILRDLFGGATADFGSAVPRFSGESITSSEAGYVFQTWVIEAFRHSDVECDAPYSIPRVPHIDNRTLAEIDGFVTIGSTNFLIESKFAKVDFDPIARLHLLAEQRPVGTMGLLFAAGGYTPPALDSAHILRPIRVLLFTRRDLENAAQQGDMSSMVRLKLREAAKFGRANYVV